MAWFSLGKGPVWFVARGFAEQPYGTAPNACFIKNTSMSVLRTKI